MRKTPVLCLFPIYIPINNKEHKILLFFIVILLATDKYYKKRLSFLYVCEHFYADFFHIDSLKGNKNIISLVITVCNIS
jgi:hypothetical protein